MMNVVLSPLGFFFSIRFAPSEGFFLFHRSAPVTGTAAGKEYRKVLRSALLPRVAAFCEPLYSVKKSCQGGRRLHGPVFGPSFDSVLTAIRRPGPKSPSSLP